MSKLKILIITHYDFASKPNGATNRVFELAKGMSVFANVKILHRGLTFKRDSIHFIGYNSKFSLILFNHILNIISPYVSWLFPSFFKALKKNIIDVDLIQVEQPYLMFSSLIVMKFLKNKPLLVLDSHNVDFLAATSKINGFSFNSILTMLTLPYIFIMEMVATKNAGKILCVSSQDKESFINFYGLPENKTLIVENGVDILKIQKASQVINPLFLNSVVFFHGTLSWYPNYEAANIIVNYLAVELPQLTFLIAGANPSKKLVNKINNTKNVKYVGFINDLEGWIKSSNVCIAPLSRGGGTKLKVLEYAAAEKPIIATLKATEGLRMVNGTHAIIHENVDQNFINSIQNVLKDDELAKKIGQNAKNLANEFDWPIIAAKLFESYLEWITE